MKRALGSGVTEPDAADLAFLAVAVDLADDVGDALEVDAALRWGALLVGGALPTTSARARLAAKRGGTVVVGSAGIARRDAHTLGADADRAGRAIRVELADLDRGVRGVIRRIVQCFAGRSRREREVRSTATKQRTQADHPNVVPSRHHVGVQAGGQVREKKAGYSLVV